MKLVYGNDLHLEFADISLEGVEGDVLVIPGDICLANQIPPKGDTNLFNTRGALLGDKLKRFFATVNVQFKRVFYVPGNHEFYHHDITTAVEGLRYALADFENIRILDNQTEVYEGHTFIGTTLWTDMDRRSPAVMHKAKFNINDYFVINKGFKRLEPIDTVELHDEAVAFLKRELATHKENVHVITHHAPTFHSINRRWVGNDLNATFAVNLEDLILDHNIDHWFHGHTHDACDYMVGKTRVLNNPRGYAGRERTQDFQFKTLEL